MKKFILFLILNIYTLYSLNITLKEKVEITKNRLFLKEIIKEDIEDIIGRIYIDIQKSPTIITSDFILQQLYNNNIYTINIIGAQTIVTIISEEKEKIESKKDLDPLSFIKNYLSQYIPQEFDIKVTLRNIEPYIDIFDIKKDFKWEIKKFEKGLKDVINLKKAILILNNKKYLVTFNIYIYTNVYISKKYFFKDEIFQKEYFIKKYLDISTYKDPEDIVLDIEKIKNLKFINNIGIGEILRWKDLNKIPLLVKEEETKAILKRGKFEIILPCVILANGNENEKVKIRLKNGKKLTGTLKNQNGESYVEL